MGGSSLPKTVTRQRRGCSSNPGPSAPQTSTLTTRLPSHPKEVDDSETAVVSTATRALQLSSVPLDVAYSLQSLRTALSGTSSCTARALQNSRRLLALYLAGSTKPPDTLTSGNY